MLGSTFGNPSIFQNARNDLGSTELHSKGMRIYLRLREGQVKGPVVETCGTAALRAWIA